MAGAKGQERTGQRAVKHEIRQIATGQYHEVRTYTQPEVESASCGKGDRRAKMNGYEMMADSYRQLVKRNTSPRGKSNSLFPCHTASVGFGAKPQEGSRGVSPAHDFTE